MKRTDYTREQLAQIGSLEELRRMRRLIDWKLDSKESQLLSQANRALEVFSWSYWSNLLLDKAELFSSLIRTVWTGYRFAASHLRRNDLRESAPSDPEKSGEEPDLAETHPAQTE